MTLACRGETVPFYAFFCGGCPHVRYRVSVNPLFEKKDKNFKTLIETRLAAGSYRVTFLCRCLLFHFFWRVSPFFPEGRQAVGAWTANRGLKNTSTICVFSLFLCKWCRVGPKRLQKSLVENGPCTSVCKWRAYFRYERVAARDAFRSEEKNPIFRILLFTVTIRPIANLGKSTPREKR